MTKIQFYMIVLQVVSLILLLCAVYVANLSLKEDNLEIRRFHCFEVISLEALAIAVSSIYTIVEFAEGYIVMPILGVLEIVAVAIGIYYMVRSYIGYGKTIALMKEVPNVSKMSS